MLMTLSLITSLIIMSPLLNLTMLPSILGLILFISLFSFSKEFSVSSLPSNFLHTEYFNCTMISLSILISLLMFMVSMKYQTFNMSPKIFSISTISLLMIVTLFFMTDNMITFYIMFEMSLIPTMVLILKWGYQPERLQSSFYFMMYTICASLPLLFIIMSIYSKNMSLSLYISTPLTFMNSNFNYFIMTTCSILAFLVKLPSWGTHLWLPKAHVEAPISGSMILAGILLKLGGFGLMKFISMFQQMNSNSLNLFYSINLWGAFLVGILCICAIDMKVMIAYSSIIHMNLLVIGLISKSLIGMVGAMLMMISHGVSSPGMFTLANVNYEKTSTRNLLLNKGVAASQPSMTMMWFLVVSANMAAPPSLNLMSEIMIYVSALKVSFLLSIPMAAITMMSGAYNLYLYSSQQGNNMMMMPPSLNNTSIMYLATLTQSTLPFIMTFCATMYFS